MSGGLALVRIDQGARNQGPTRVVESSFSGRGARLNREVVDNKFIIRFDSISDALKFDKFLEGRITHRGFRYSVDVSGRCSEELGPGSRAYELQIKPSIGASTELQKFLAKNMAALVREYRMKRA